MSRALCDSRSRRTCHTARPRTPLAPFSFCLALALASPATTQTHIEVTTQPLRTNVHPFGINLSGQTFYDSGQLLSNLIVRNPGFEGGTWQTILHCKSATPNTCTDENPYTVWPANFIANAHAEVLSTGLTTTVLSSTTTHPPQGITVTLAPLKTPITAGDFLIVRLDKPGNAEAGWWPTLHNGATLSTETHDLSPHTPGKQALRINASAPNQSADLASFFDTLENHSFVQLHGPHRLTFRAKPLIPNTQLTLDITRLDAKRGRQTFLHKTLTLTPNWNDYAFDFPTNEPPNSIGPVSLTFSLTSASILLDDVSLTAITPHPQPFRAAVVQTLKDLHPGILRYMDNGTSFGSSFANLIAPEGARQRSGYSTQTTLAEDIPIGLPDFLWLCQQVGADPWITLPPGFTPDEATHLIAFLAPYTKSFHKIHLELGNEQWNTGSFHGATIADPTAYARRASTVFSAARHSPLFKPESYDLILGSWFNNTWWTQQELAANTAADTIAVAPYLFSEFNSAPNEESTFGPMFAQPEQLDSRPSGLMAQQAAAVAAHHANQTKLAIYETNLGTASGTVPQSAIDVTVPSLGAGLAVADHMLLMLRDLGITDQCLFALPEFRNDFTNTQTHTTQSTPLWGAVIDMGGPTNRRRPSFLALQLINHAILPTMVATRISGSNPIWNQPPSPNDKIALDNAHLLQTFAFADGHNHSLILFNLSRDQPLPITLQGPTPNAHQTTLTAPHLTDNNETSNQVAPHPTPYTPTQSLPPHSLTTITWTTP